MSLEERFEAKIERLPSGCWQWRGATSERGYGHLFDGVRRARPAHVIAYELAHGPVPDGKELDHLCRNPSCVNPAHLEAVTHRENMRRGLGWAGVNARKTHCAQGHAYDEANTYVCHRPDGAITRTCRLCNSAAVARYKARRPT